MADYRTLMVVTVNVTSSVECGRRHARRFTLFAPQIRDEPLAASGISRSLALRAFDPRQSSRGFKVPAATRDNGETCGGNAGVAHGD